MLYAQLHGALGFTNISTGRLGDTLTWQIMYRHNSARSLSYFLFVCFLWLVQLYKVFFGARPKNIVPFMLVLYVL